MGWPAKHGRAAVVIEVLPRNHLKTTSSMASHCFDCCDGHYKMAISSYAITVAAYPAGRAAVCAALLNMAIKRAPMRYQLACARQSTPWYAHWKEVGCST